MFFTSNPTHLNTLKCKAKIEHHLKSFSTDLNKSHPSQKPKNLWWCKKRPIYSYTSSCHDISLSPEDFPNIPHAPSSPHKYSISRVHKYSTNPAEIQIQYSSRALPCSPYDCPVLSQLPKKTHCFLPKNYPQTASSYTHLCPISLAPTLFDAWNKNMTNANTKS